MNFTTQTQQFRLLSLYGVFSLICIIQQHPEGSLHLIPVSVPMQGKSLESLSEPTTHQPQGVLENCQVFASVGNMQTCRSVYGHSCSMCACLQTLLLQQ